MSSAPSLLDRHRAEEAQPVCTPQRALLLSFSVAGCLLFLVSVNTVSPPVMRVRSSDIARRAMEHRSLAAAGAVSGATSRAAVPLMEDQGLSPPPPPTALSAPPPSPAGVADKTCHARLHSDYMGERAPVWGLGNPGFHLKDAAECCAACQAHAAVCGKPGSQSKSWWPARPEMRCGGNPGCNIWVFCPEKQCFAFDIHVHTQGECWLKQQAKNITGPKDPHEGHTTFPAAMRRSPRKVWPWAVDEKIWPGEIPEHVPWIAGVLAPADAVVSSARADDQWRKRWCDKHGPTYGGCDEYKNYI